MTNPKQKIENVREMYNLLAGGGVAETDEKSPERITKIRTKETNFLNIVVVLDQRTECSHMKM